MNSINKHSFFEKVEPWFEPVDGAILLSEILNTIKRFIVCDTNTAHAAALWITLTWLIDSIHVAPIAMITSPEKRCGKTQLLTLFRYLCRRPLIASNITASAIFRSIEEWSPTLLLDEFDAYLKGNEDMRGILNSGHAKETANIIRTERIGDSFKCVTFSTWGAKAVAGIGKLPDTLMDRSIILALRRKLKDDKVDKLRNAENDLFKNIRRKIARWALDYADSVKFAKPIPLETLNDRAQDNWESMLAIADLIGGEWPKNTRIAATALSGSAGEAVSINVELLSDIRDAFDHSREEKMWTFNLIQALCEDEEKPWATWNRGYPIKPKQLANRLGEFNIKSIDIRIGKEVKKGYSLEMFEEAFIRYLPEADAVSLQSTIRDDLVAFDWGKIE